MNTLLHIPHTSLNVPKIFYDGLTIPKELFHKYNLKMTDVGVDELFKDVKGKRIKAKYSRLFCDVERFRDDEKEVMAKYGEGVVYTKLFDGTNFHNHNDEYKNLVLQYYDEYHKKIDNEVEKLLMKDKDLLILDCHSFSDEMASYFFNPPFPDICIGVEEEYYNEKILNKITSEIEKRGYSYKINYPYSGSFVPNIIYGKKIKGNVTSIMIEVNKRIYL